MAFNLKFLDENGVLFWWYQLKDKFATKVDKDQGMLNGGKFMKVNSSTGLLEPADLPDTGVIDTKVDGTSVVTSGVANIDLATPLATKQNKLTSSQLTVVNAEPYSTTDKNKLAGIQDGAEANLVTDVTVNGASKLDGTVAKITVPTKLTDLSSTDFDYVEGITAGSSNVVIGGTAKNPTIAVDVERVNDYNTTESITGNQGDTKVGLDLDLVTGIGNSVALAEGDIVFFNGGQGKAVNINTVAKTYDLVITRLDTVGTFANLGGVYSDNASLLGALNNKQNKLTTGQQDAVDSGITATKVSKLDGIATGAQVNVIEGAKLNGAVVPIVSKILQIDVDEFNPMTYDFGEENEGLFVVIGAGGEGFDFGTITAITNQEILDIMEM